MVEGEEEDGPFADEVAESTFSSDIDRLPCRTFSRKYEFRIELAVSGVRMRAMKD